MFSIGFGNAYIKNNGGEGPGGPVGASGGLRGPEWERRSERGQEMVRKVQRGPEWVRGGEGRWRW